MSAEKFSLKWNDFQRNVSNSFSKLRQESRLYDVTLVTNDHQLVSAHKLVLSACSEVFSNIFNSNNSPNMMLYLDSVDIKEINLMLDYIYQGEVSIGQEYLDRFLEIATKFQLQGLLTDDNGEEVQETQHYETYVETKEKEYIDEIIPEEKGKIVKERSIIVNNQNLKANNDEIEDKFAELVEKEDCGTYVCTVCEKKIKIKRDMRRHLETHLSGLSYNCSPCGKSFRSSNSMRKHNERNHPGVSNAHL